MYKAGLILEGGSVRGVFTAGVLDYFMEQKLDLAYVAGVSAGACNAVDYVSQQIGRTRDCMAIKEKKYRYISSRNLIKKRSLFDMDMVFDKYPNEYFPFDYDTYFASDVKCEMVVTNCLTGQAEYLDDRSDRLKLMAICRASSSMPFVSSMVEIDGVPYLDGGLADSIPIGRAQELGYEKNIVILTQNRSYRKQDSARMNKLYARVYKRYPELVKTMCSRPEMYNRSLVQVHRAENAGKAYVIRPQIPVVSRTETDYDTLMRFYNHGYEYAQKHFGEVVSFLE